MLYQDATDNVLDQDIFVDMNEAERAGSTDRVRIVSQIERYRGSGQSSSAWPTAKRFYVTRDQDLHVVRSQQLADLGRVNMADPKTLIDFVAWAIKTYPADKYLLQEKVVPETVDGRRSWFRGFYVLGEVHLTWWDDRTHIYAELGPDEAVSLGLAPIYAIVRTIARVSRLRFFSTEIARAAGGRIVVVDYVNEICDMRLRSVHPDGVPDAVVGRIADRIAAHAGAAAARDLSG